MIPARELHTLGTVRLELEPEEIVNGPGEFCEVDAGASRCERTDSEGATVFAFLEEHLDLAGGSAWCSLATPDSISAILDEQTYSFVKGQS